MRQAKTILLRPKQILRDISGKWPNAWQDIKRFRSDKGRDLPDWPDWCYMPIAAGFVIAASGNDGSAPRDVLDMQLSPAVIVAAATWRISQGVYRFDADLYNALVGQPLDGSLPCEALKRLPEWCVYIETIGATFYGNPIVGFWAHMEYDTEARREELRLVLLHEDKSNIPLPIHLGDWTIDEGIRRMYSEADRQIAAHDKDFRFPRTDLASDIAPLVQLVLYLCADNADMPARPVHPGTRLRMSGQVDVAREPRFWTVGERIGAAIRKHRNQPQQAPGIEKADVARSAHASPRPHMRRAHWHHYWTGPREGERKLVLRWLPPIPIGVKGDDYEGPAVIRRVRAPDSKQPE